MSNWWLQWAERIALVLAEWWMRSKSGEGEAPDAVPPAPHAEPDQDAPPGPGADMDTRPH